MQNHEMPPLALQLLFLSKHLGHLMERRLAGRKLNRTQAIVLTTLRHQPGLKALDLSGPARVEPANVTRTLQALERLGLLQRQPHPTDGRAVQLYLTPAGEALAQDLEDGLEKLSEELMRAVDPADLPHMERAMEALRRWVNDQLPGSHWPPTSLYREDCGASALPEAPVSAEDCPSSEAAGAAGPLAPNAGSRSDI